MFDSAHTAEHRRVKLIAINPDFPSFGRRVDSCVPWRITMLLRTTLAAALMAAAAITTTGCAVSRGQETTGAYIDDSTITATVKSRFVESKNVDAASISVETLNSTVMLSGFAKNATEKSTAETIARGVSGVKAVKNEIAVRP
jgi:hyperosmotically inducible protein